MRRADSMRGLTYIAATLCLAVSPLKVFADTQTGQYQLDHRFLSSSSSSSSTQSQGAFLPFASVRFEENADGDGDLQVEDISKTKGDAGISVGGGKGWYQLALHDWDSTSDDGDEWLITSIPICHLASSQRFNLDILLSQTNVPFSISLSASSSDSSAGCASNNNSTVSLPSIERLNVIPRYTSTMKDPSLIAPRTDPSTGLPTNTDPPPEKGFLLKYWMYILAAGLFFAIIMGPDEPPAGGK